MGDRAKPHNWTKQNLQGCGRGTGENVTDHYLQPVTGNQMLLKYIKRVFSNTGLPAQGEQSLQPEESDIQPHLTLFLLCQI